MSRVVLLLGAGVSYDARVPGLQDITSHVLAGAGVWRHSGGTYSFDAANPNATEPHLRRPVEDVLALLRVLPGDDYEQLALLLQQVRDFETEYESPAIGPFASQLAGRLGLDERELRERCAEALGYIADVACELLSRGDLERVEHLAALIDIFRGGEAAVATLNHDVLFEAALRQAGVPFADGFTSDGRWMDSFPAGVVPLLKLHGLVDWWCCSEGPRYVRGAAPDGSVRPLILTGTFTKILAYEQAVIADVHLRFGEHLREAEHLVVAGYGFADKAINSRVIHWMDREPSHRLTVVDPNAAASARPAVGRGLARWSREGRLTLVVRGIGDVDMPMLLG